MKTLLRDRRIRCFYFASAVSTFGDYALFVALAVWVKQLTGSTGASGLTFLMLVVGALSLPATSVLIDRFRRKLLLIGTYLCTALLLLGLLMVRHAEQVWIIYVLALLYGASGAFSNAAQQALTPGIVTREQLAAANGLHQSLTQGVRLFTPAVGVGLLVWQGAAAVVLLDIGTFILAASLMMRIPILERSAVANEQHPTVPDGEHEPIRSSWLNEMTDGFRYVWQHPVLRQTCLSLTIAVFCMGFYETLDLQVATVGLHHDASWLGFMLTMQGIGGILGGMMASQVTARVGDGRLAAAGMACMTMFSLLSAIPLSVVVLAGALLCGVGIAWLLVGATTLAQRETPDFMMGRVNGVVSLSIQAPQIAGIALGAVLIDSVSYRMLCVLVACGVTIAAAYLTCRKEQRRGVGATAVNVGLKPSRSSERTSQL